MASEQNRFLQLQHPRAPRRKTWGSCLGGLSCFRKQKGGGKRIVPATRISEANPLLNQPNGPHLPPNQTSGIALSLFAPPSSPASFSNSALASTAQSPTCYLSSNSPVSPSSNTMFVTGPYAYETQLVSPPVFSTFTTEPSTAPFTPPPELAHLTTPSSPDVPYAHFLSSSKDPAYKKSNSGRFFGAAGAGTARDCISSSSSFNESEYPQKWDSLIPSQEEPAYKKSNSGRSLGAAGAAKSRQDSNFFCPETFAQFYLDHSSFSNSGGRLSISKESDAYSNGGNGYQNRQSKTCKPDAEEVEAYRASFGFSADEIITTSHYVEISDGLNDTFSMTPSTSNKPVSEGINNHDEGLRSGLTVEVSQKRYGDAGRSHHTNHLPSDDDDIFSKMGSSSRIGRKYQFGSSNSDAEVEYRRGRSLREGRSSWRET